MYATNVHLRNRARAQRNTLRTSLKEVFIMSKKNEMQEKAPTKWQRIWFSQLIGQKNKSHKIAYVAVLTALTVAVNMFEIKFAQTQFSLTILACALTGIIIGPALGFVVGFLGDLVGFLYQSGGYMYAPWIGIAMGMAAFIAGFIMGAIDTRGIVGMYCKLGIVCALIFLVCTVGINTTGFWLMYAKGTPYNTYLFTRLIAQGQIVNSFVNYVLLFILVPVVNKIKPFKIRIS